MALWRTRTLTPAQKAEEDQDERPIMLEDAGPILDVEDAKMSKVYSAELPINVSGSSLLCFIVSLSIQEGLPC